MNSKAVDHPQNSLAESRWDANAGYHLPPNVPTRNVGLDLTGDFHRIVTYTVRDSISNDALKQKMVIAKVNIK